MSDSTRADDVKKLAPMLKGLSRERVLACAARPEELWWCSRETVLGRM